MNILLTFVFGTLFGATVSFFVTWLRQKQEANEIIGKAKESFAELSLNALARNSEEFLRLAHTKLENQGDLTEKQLDHKKELIDQTFHAMKQELGTLREVVTGAEKERIEKYGELSQYLKNTAEQTERLHQVTSKIQNALAGTSTRGQWGERIADDILSLLGLIEGVNYQRQKTLLSSGTRPDYTFLLPQGLKVNMDVKFPLTNYWRYCESTNESERQQHSNQFLKDVRNRVKEVTSREYINPEENTLDYVIMFIPNEQVYGFINELDHAIFFDEALRSKVIVCSPVTLYAILAVIRQAIDNFNFEKTSAEVLSIIGGFYKQWELYTKEFDKLEKAIDETQKEFAVLTTTRRRQLERQVKKIESIREQRKLPTLLLEDEPSLSE